MTDDEFAERFAAFLESTRERANSFHDFCPVDGCALRRSLCALTWLLRSMDAQLVDLQLAKGGDS